MKTFFLILLMGLPVLAGETYTLVEVIKVSRDGETDEILVKVRIDGKEYKGPVLHEDFSRFEKDAVEQKAVLIKTVARIEKAAKAALPQPLVRTLIDISRIEITKSDVIAADK